ncbi:flavin-containing monooxygenase [Nocardia miyunensis]|uniref:flavin-containing monooxygenase n=1 Tax=Nocardia miyunensis TaxID=282684 RepID=UPI00083484D5|nr:NAD(P)/FAD-dependent oxidoreductase [Nocardia miyunensis]
MTATETETTTTEATTFDVLVIGAGISGMYQLHLLREEGLSVRVLEAGSDVGGTWHWNRYPGARLDSESYSYQYAFTTDLLEDWDWSELFSGQPELERYFQTVADRYDLRRDIEFDTRVTAMTFDEQANTWKVTTDTGKTFVAPLVITCTGVLSAPIYPHIPGIDRFRGESYHTALWPKETVTFENKKVVVIGTGATGIQAITEVAKTAGHLTVCQRTANWAVPLRNQAMTPERMAEIRAGYPDMFENLQHTFSGFLHDWDPVPTTAYSPEELQERFQKAWDGPGFAKWMGLPNDIATSAEANQKWCDFLVERIKERVSDPATAARLTPNDHYFGTKRVPCESGYYEVFNQENVDLVSLKENPIVEITETGVRTESGDIDADMIIFATGFEAFSGALKRIHITGVGGRTLQEAWSDGPVTYLGVQVAGFPNLFIMGGPHGKGGHGNGPRCAEKVQEWMTDFAKHIFDESIVRVEADPQAQLEWSDEVQERAMKGLMAQTKSAFFGDNLADDDPNKPRKRTYLAYVGALDEYVDRLKNLTKNGYPGFVITS